MQSLFHKSLTQDCERIPVGARPVDKPMETEQQ